MIVPMKYLTLLCVERDKKRALHELAKLGILHVEERIRDSAGIIAAQNAVESAKRAMTVVGIASGKGDWKQLTIKESALSADHDTTIVGDINRSADSYAIAKARSLELAREIADYEVWGDFDLEMAAKLSSEGLPVKLFTMADKAEVPVPESGYLHIVGSGRNGKYGVAVGTEVPEGATFVAMPRARLLQVEAEYKAALDTMKLNADKLAAYNDSLEEIQAELNRRMEAGDYISVSDNMPGSGAVAYLIGFIDARQENNAIASARDNGWGIVVRDPLPDETPPTQLEPSRIFRPVLALFKALGITPGYTESDVSVPFFFFFSIFFAMLVGDAGYGAIILGLTLYLHGKTKAATAATGKKPSLLISSWIKLLYFFSSSTILYGLLSGTIFGTTYFGMDMHTLPAFIQKSVALLADQDYMMQLCFTIGAVHLSVARVWNAMILWPSKKMLAELGWVGVIWSMYLLVCTIVMDPSKFTYPFWGPYLLLVSVVLIFLFMLDKSELKTQGISLAMLPLNIMSSLGDVISYVRLYAVGLASVKLAENFNSMALDMDLPMLIKIPVVVLILGFGHGLNLAMAALSILVHGVRLNTLEFSGAKGVSWSGYTFKPFTALDPVAANAANDPQRES